MKTLRSKLAILTVLALCLCGCRVDGISRGTEAVLGLPLAVVGVAPSWDVNRGHFVAEGPGPLRGTPWLRFALGLPLFPLLMPPWEEEYEKKKGRDWWSQRVASDEH